MIKAKKSLSQNFLIDKNIAKKIVSQTLIRNRIVIEIGPGKGFLTDAILSENPKKIYLIEKDFQLTDYLNKKYKDIKKINIINKNILNFDLKKFKRVKIISNLPYNISTKVILYLFKYISNIDEMVFMIQKEVSIKFDYNIIGMNKYKFFTKLTSNYNKCFDVSRKVFIPKPKVDSSVVKFILKNKKIDFDKAESFSKNIFLNRRKKINNKLNIENISKENILNKRVDEITIDELFYIYNSF